MAGFYSATQQHNAAAPLDQFVTAAHTLADPALIYSDTLHNIAALARLERHVVTEIAKQSRGSPERLDLIHVLHTAAIYGKALRIRGTELRKELVAELAGGQKPTSLADEMRPITMAEIEAVLSADMTEEAAKSTVANETVERQDRAEAIFFKLAGIRPLPLNFREKPIPN